MCDLVEQYAQKVAREIAEQVEKETAERVEKETAERVEKETTEREARNAAMLFAEGVSYPIVRRTIAYLSDDELQRIYQESLKGHSYV